MALSKVTINVQDGNLGQVAPSGANSVLKFGVCTDGVPGELYTFNSLSNVNDQLGLGSGAELVGVSLALAGGGPVGFVPVGPEVAGAVGDVTHVGSGTGAIAVSTAPHKQVTLVITESGLPGVGKYKVELGSDAYGSELTIPGAADGYTARVLGTFMQVEFGTSSYTAGDSFVIDTSGDIVQTGGSPAITITADPIDNYNVLLTVVKAGGVGTAKAVIALDGVNQSGGAFLLTSAVAVPNTGLVLEASNTFVVGDTYKFLTCGPTMTSSACNDAAVDLQTQQAFSMLHMDNMSASSSAAASFADMAVTVASAYKADNRFVRVMTNCPTKNNGVPLLGGATGSVAQSGGNLVECAEADSAVESSFEDIAAERLGVGARDCILTSPLSGLALRRPWSWAVMGRMAQNSPATDAAWVGEGAIPGVGGISGDERFVEGLSDAGFTVPTTISGRSGFFVNQAITMASKNLSDYSFWSLCRIMDLACDTAYNVLVDYLNSEVLVDPNSGDILEASAVIIENKVNNALNVRLVSASPPQASAARCIIDRAHDILSDNTLFTTITVTPPGYIRDIVANIGFGLLS